MKLRHGDTDIRLSQEPFPLYPGETLKQSVTPLRVVAANCALRIMVRRSGEEEEEEEASYVCRVWVVAPCLTILRIGMHMLIRVWCFLVLDQIHLTNIRSSVRMPYAYSYLNR